MGALLPQFRQKILLPAKEPASFPIHSPQPDLDGVDALSATWQMYTFARAHARTHGHTRTFYQKATESVAPCVSSTCCSNFAHATMAKTCGPEQPAQALLTWPRNILQVHNASLTSGQSDTGNFEAATCTARHCLRSGHGFTKPEHISSLVTSPDIWLVMLNEGARLDASLPNICN